MTTVRRVLAANASPYTGPGTNTWVVGDEPVKLVIDPGPDSSVHRGRIVAALGQQALGAVLVTHSHADHLEGAERLAAAHHARVLRFPQLQHGEVVRIGRLSVIALHTPGHAADHLAFWLAEDRVLFSGDLILGRGSSMVTYPEGDVAQYLRSLDLVAELKPRLIFPGHWDPIQDPAAKIAEYRQHRLQRELQVLSALAAGPTDLGGLANRVYAELEAGSALRQAAEMTLQAHLRKLIQEGRAREVGGFYRSSG
ncbi:MAG: MBL fold metallo-hydrolase [Candidatus Dormibacteraeota bacterium]|uniref:MBL fold metallo-hydrolase n=1 Tax=Candidatus Dormiibacter inghamiae TaxID=3127013 RepID=A0A934KAM5_9BACT|nr:MBL fold metallo-hydrolase [Candidatus Dormibacteraeota bacterium]MBJ7607064.1 MBL fold metallo-hydrolase [Candidatus Dormibacteraeota bacterium]